MIGDYCDHMFYIPIYHLSVVNWNHKKKQLQDLYQNSSLEKKDSVHTDYHKQFEKGKYSYNENLEKIFSEEIEKIEEILQFKSCIRHSWFETSYQNEYHGIHSHGPVGYSGVCYIDYDSNCHTPTQFVAPFSNFMNGHDLHYVPTVEEGSLILFPASILHHTLSNLTDKPRTIVSFNLYPKEI